jgi:hypothetical protein
MRAAALCRNFSSEISVSFVKKERYASADEPVSAETKQVNEDRRAEVSG